MSWEVRHLERCQFPMATDVHRYFHHMGNRAHSAWFSVHEEYLPGTFLP